MAALVAGNDLIPGIAAVRLTGVVINKVLNASDSATRAFRRRDWRLFVGHARSCTSSERESRLFAARSLDRILMG